MSRSDRSRTLKRLAIGSGLAAAAGYLVGVVTAPKSGKQLRGDIKSKADQSRSDAEKELKKLHTELDQIIKDAKHKSGRLTSRTGREARGLINKAGDTKEKIREVISAIHEGDANDEDLKRAVKSAGLAIEHLKDFLKK